MDGTPKSPEAAVGAAPEVGGLPPVGGVATAEAPVVGAPEAAPGIVTTPGVPEYQAPASPDASAAVASPDVSVAPAPTPEVAPAPVDVAAPAPDVAPAPVVDAAATTSVDSGLLVGGVPPVAEPATVAEGWGARLKHALHIGREKSPVKVTTSTVPTDAAPAPSAS